MSLLLSVRCNILTVRGNIHISIVREIVSFCVHTQAARELKLTDSPLTV